MLPRGYLAKGVACAAVAIVSWGLMFPVAKRTLPVLDAFALGSVRYAIGTLIFVALLAAIEGRGALAWEGRFVPAALFGLVGFAGFNVFVYLGLTTTRPEHASIILTLQTPLTALAVWFIYGQRPAAFTLGCAALAVAGVVLVVTGGDPAQVLAGGSLAGDALVLLGGVSWVTYTLAGRHLAGWSPLRMTVLTCIPGTVALLILNALAIALGWARLPTLDAIVSVKWQIGYLAVFTVVLAVLAFNAAVKFLGAMNTILMLNFIPVTVFAVEAALGRRFSAFEIGGAAVVVGALAANNFYLRRRVPDGRAGPTGH